MRSTHCKCCCRTFAPDDFSEDDWNFYFVPFPGSGSPTGSIIWNGSDATVTVEAGPDRPSLEITPGSLYGAQGGWVFFVPKPVPQLTPWRNYTCCIRTNNSARVKSVLSERPQLYNQLTPMFPAMIQTDTGRAFVVTNEYIYILHDIIKGLDGIVSPTLSGPGLNLPGFPGGTDSQSLIVGNWTAGFVFKFTGLTFIKDDDAVNNCTEGNHCEVLGQQWVMEISSAVVQATRTFRTTELKCECGSFHYDEPTDPPGPFSVVSTQTFGGVPPPLTFSVNWNNRANNWQLSSGPTFYALRDAFVGKSHGDSISFAGQSHAYGFVVGPAGPPSYPDPGIFTLHDP